jgi:uncharacterized protein
MMATMIWHRWSFWAWSVVSAVGMSACGPQRFFYYPDQTLYNDPAVLKISHEVVSYPSRNGKTLYGLWLPAAGPSRGTVIHFHGNFGNVSNHFPAAIFLTREGFDVLTFDYQGYGASEGRPTAKNTVEDGLASVDYALGRDRSGRGVAIFGQSLGGAVGIVVAAKDARVKGAVIEAAFASYASMTRHVLGKYVWLWPLYPIFPLFVNHSYAPDRFVGDIAPRPLLFVHGASDEIVPAFMSERLHERAKEPKTLWIIPDAKHLGVQRVAGDLYKKTIGEFLESCFRSRSE